MSDEILLDQVLMPEGGIGRQNAAHCFLSRGTCRISTLSTQGVSLATVVNNFSARSGATWSERSAEASGMARACYRALNGQLFLSSIPAVVHELNEADGDLAFSDLILTGSAKRTLANDVTVCGEQEPTAYITEYFLGDGATSQFSLGAAPWFPTAGKTAIIRELFKTARDQWARVWGTIGGAGYLTLGSNGLAMQGGNGLDRQALLSWLNPIELGGTLLMEAVGVTLAAAVGPGILAGFFTQPETADSCIAGFQVTAQAGTGALTLQPLVIGCANRHHVQHQSRESVLAASPRTLP